MNNPVSKSKKMARDYQYAFDERYVIRRDRLNRNIDISNHRDEFSCPYGSLYFFDKRDITYFGVQRKEQYASWLVSEANFESHKFYGEDA